IEDNETGGLREFLMLWSLNNRSGRDSTSSFAYFLKEDELILRGPSIFYQLHLRRPVVAEKKDRPEEDADDKDVAGPPPPPVAITPAEFAGEMLTVDLPAQVADVAVGGGCRFLVLHLPKVRQLAIFDVSEAKIKNTINVDDDSVLFGAGM